MVAKLWSKAWKSATQPRKQRKYNANAPLHIKRRMLKASLSKELKKEHGTRSFPVKKGDTVKIMSGQFKDLSGKVTRVSYSRARVFVENVVIKRRDSTEALYPLHASNLQITKLDLSDKKRADKLASFKKKDKKEDKK